MSKQPNSVVVLSGGQDSSTSLLVANDESDVQACVHFRYGQRHAVEEECAVWWADEIGVPLLRLDVPALAQIGNSALVDPHSDISESHPVLSDLPASFVPGRNLVMLHLAAAVAMKYNATRVYAGVCQRDFSGYPDCRGYALRAVEASVAAGMGFEDVRIVAPLLNRTKADTWAVARRYNRVGDMKEHTHTCYQGQRDSRHEWGYGCGQCPACEIRADGYYEWAERS